jgi:hypothetical protein
MVRWARRSNQICRKRSSTAIFPRKKFNPAVHKGKV